MIELFGDSPGTRVFVAPPGAESEVRSLDQIIDGERNPVFPWVDLGISSDPPRIVIRSSLYVLVLESMQGDWEALQKLGADVLFSVAVLQIKPTTFAATADGTLVGNFGPASIDHLQVHAADSRFQGRIDVKLLGEMRNLKVQL